MRRGGMHAWRRRVGRLAAWIGMVWIGATWIGGVAGVAVAQGPARVTHLDIEAEGITRLAASPNGQTVFAIDATGRSVVAIDPVAAGRRRDVVGPAAGAGAFEPAALVALPGDILAVVGRAGDAWSLATYRLRPGEAVDGGRPLQSLPLGPALGPEAVAMAVSRSRGWCAVTGLPEPQPAVIRVAFAGPGVRRRPDDPMPEKARGRPVAVAIGPADELVTIESAAGADAAVLVFTGSGGRELLRLDTGLVGIRGLAFARDGSTLWVIAGAALGRPPQPAGLWRLDAGFRDGRQVVLPTCVVPLDDPQALVAVADRSLVVVHGTGPRRLSRIDPTDGDLVSGGPTAGEHQEEQSR